MKIRRLFPAVVACASVAVAWLATPPPAWADCQPAGPRAEAIAGAPLVFVGTVIELQPAKLRVAAFVGYDRLSR